jgi:hypothetical protein
MKKTILLICFLTSITGFSQEKKLTNKEAILKVMKAQEVAWSNHNLAGFLIIFRKIKGEWKIVADTSC